MAGTVHFNMTRRQVLVGLSSLVAVGATLSTPPPAAASPRSAAPVSTVPTSNYSHIVGVL